MLAEYALTNNVRGLNIKHFPKRSTKSRFYRIELTLRDCRLARGYVLVQAVNRLKSTSAVVSSNTCSIFCWLCGGLLIRTPITECLPSVRMCPVHAIVVPYAGSSGRTKKKVARGRHRDAESAETSTPFISWGPQPQWEDPPRPPGNSSTSWERYLPRIAMLARGICYGHVSVLLCVSQVEVLSKHLNIYDHANNAIEWPVSPLYGRKLFDHASDAHLHWLESSSYHKHSEDQGII